MKTYQITLTGITPLLMHNDNISWRDQIKKWQMNPQNKGRSIPGDDRSPAFTWIGCLYHDGGKLGIPSDNLMTGLRDGASMVSAGGKKTFKTQSQAGILVNEIAWPLLVDGREVPVKPLLELLTEPEFEKHEETAKKYGFSLFCKSAKIGKSKHIRVRPRFENWTYSGTVTVFDETITMKILESILTQAGFYAGLCDWRPGSRPSPGQFGKFEAAISEMK